MKTSILKLNQAGSGIAGILFIALIPLLNSCLQSPSADPTPISYVSVYHASPDAAGLDIVVNDVKLNTNSFNYGNYSGYVNFNTGLNSFKINTTGSTSKLVDTTFTFKTDRIYSVFIVNRLSKLQTLMVKDSSASASTGNARVRLVHVSPDAPAIDIFASGTSSEVLFSSRTFKTSTEYLEVPAKTYTLNVRTSTGGTAIGTGQEIVIQEGRYYTLLVQGFVTPPSGNTNALKLQLISN